MARQYIQQQRRQPIGGHQVAAIRTWDEVKAEFNRRNPDQPLADETACRMLGAKAIRRFKLRLGKMYPQTVEDYQNVG